MGGVGAAIGPGVSFTPNLYYTATSADGSVGGTAASVSISFQFRATFDSGGGTPVSDQYVDVGGVVTEPAPPTRAGFDFTGWHVGGATGPAWDASAAIDSGLSLVATWHLVDRSELRALVDGAVTDELDYTPATWSVYVTALSTGQAVLDDPAATQAEVDAASAALESAAGGLVPRADFTALEQAVSLARALPANGTGSAEFDYDSWAGLADAHDELEALLGLGGAVLGDLNSTQAVVDTAASELLERLNHVNAGMALATTVAEIEALVLVDSDYTPESWATLREALDDALSALGAVPLPGGEVLGPLNDALRDAWKALEARPQPVLPVMGTEVAPLLGGAVSLVLLGGLALAVNLRRRGTALR